MNMRQRIPRPAGKAAGLLATALLTATSAQLMAAEPVMVPRGQRFEATFRSEVAYTNHPGVSLRVEFRSPQGERRVVPGFWDGGKVWRARFAPGVAGRWSYRTS